MIGRRSASWRARGTFARLHSIIGCITSIPTAITTSCSAETGYWAYTGARVRRISNACARSGFGCKIRNGPGSEWVEEAAAEGPFRLNEGVEQAVTVDGRLGEEAVGRGPTPEASRDDALRRWVDEVAKNEKTP